MDTEFLQTIIENDHDDSPPGISRRNFIKMAAIRMAAAAGLLAGCSPAQQPTATPGPTMAPTDTPAPTGTPQPLQKVPGKVVRARHAGVWNDDVLVEEALRQMLDASIAKLTDIDDAGTAWAALFKPGERIAIKVNAIRDSRYWTHVPLVTTVTECLQNAGVPAEQIIIFDRATAELRVADYPINEDGPGVRCYGSDSNYTAGWTVMDTDIRLSDILLDCDALINMPVLKAHAYSGFTFAMKNHYGTCNKPQALHRRIPRAIAELNALEPIRERTRLIIGDALTVCPTPDWHRAVTGDSILTSFDPVAHDLVGLQMLGQAIDADGIDRAAAVNMGIRCLQEGGELGLGVNEPDGIQWLEITL